MKCLIRLGMGSMTVKITRSEFSAEELRRKAGRVRDANQSRRLLALASILDGAPRGDAARNAGMDRQTLRDWVHRYNTEGVAGLLDRPRSGRKPLLSEDQLAEFDSIVETTAGPSVGRRGSLALRRTQGKYRKTLQRRTLGALGGTHLE